MGEHAVRACGQCETGGEIPRDPGTREIKGLAAGFGALRVELGAQRYVRRDAPAGNDPGKCQVPAVFVRREAGPAAAGDLPFGGLKAHPDRQVQPNVLALAGTEGDVEGRGQRDCEPCLVVERHLRPHRKIADRDAIRLVVDTNERNDHPDLDPFDDAQCGIDPDLTLQPASGPSPVTINKPIEIRSASVHPGRR